MVFPFINDRRFHPTPAQYQQPSPISVARFMPLGCLFAAFWYQDVTKAPKNNSFREIQRIMFARDHTSTPQHAPLLPESRQIFRILAWLLKMGGKAIPELNKR
jgi:hypothetical protein